MLCLKGFRVICIARNREGWRVGNELGNCFDYVVADLLTID
jgi:hypothetical protein